MRMFVIYVPTYCLNYSYKNYDMYFIIFFKTYIKSIFFIIQLVIIYSNLFLFLIGRKTKFFYKIKHYPLNLNNTIFIGQSKF